MPKVVVNFLEVVDPDDPNDPVFLGFIDPVAPSVTDFAPGANGLADSDDDPDADEVAGDFLASGTNGLADSDDPDWALSEVEPLAQYDPGPGSMVWELAITLLIVHTNSCDHP